ncbi:MAG: hypothetical protein GTO53_08915 [Planctomycetales bacterium]|nr:hypothetical protein [Planctomycetales bacterium]NIM09248.1 hypothetical protein [Planctomycetales bacterium]NIN08718.1 hypothetical protein [Planctomycetales bacterium]NIN77834.1 hypothetical protein [Planctomycetales bacterium]NIO35013.1 hypothetical protein [Planctomycetales bacterium]
MQTITVLEEALSAIRQLSYEIREECVGGNGGGVCVLRGRKIFFMDPSLDVADQLEMACDALRADPGVYRLDMSDPLRGMLGIRRSA